MEWLTDMYPDIIAVPFHLRVLIQYSTVHETVYCTLIRPINIALFGWETNEESIGSNARTLTANLLSFFLVSTDVLSGFPFLDVYIWHHAVLNWDGNYSGLLSGLTANRKIIPVHSLSLSSPSAANTAFILGDSSFDSICEEACSVVHRRRTTTRSGTDREIFKPRLWRFHHFQIVGWREETKQIWNDRFLPGRSNCKSSIKKLLKKYTSRSEDGQETPTKENKEGQHQHQRRRQQQRRQRKKEKGFTDTQDTRTVKTDGHQKPFTCRPQPRTVCFLHHQLYLWHIPNRIQNLQATFCEILFLVTPRHISQTS